MKGWGSGEKKLGNLPLPRRPGVAYSRRLRKGTEADMTEPAKPVAKPRTSIARRALRWAVPVVVIAVAAGVWQRERLWIWYCAERLERASRDTRSEWAQQLASAGEPAVPTLLNLLRNDDEGVCAATAAATDALVASWPANDPRRLAFARQFVDAEPRFSTPGRAAALELLPTILAGCEPDVVVPVKGLVAHTAQSESVDVRIKSIAAALRPEIDYLEAIIPLVDDPCPEVRRAAVLALGPVADGKKPAVGDEMLLRCLHDSDAEVRQFAEMGLKSRGRTPREIRLGRRYAAPSAAERQKLLIDLAEEDELDTTVWLERLTNDSDPSVRAGAARLASERNADLADRLAQMSRSDPDQTVRRIAEYYRQRMLARR
jgi:HEAT repeat protein